ncbi:putative rubber elongation factor [Rosa chinensis]|uniref:Putative rubber elongation factor n=2 Tax=Rosa chinensis TaxID=74649 RepID=A0A2P6R0C4_ROSCH|nr:putative rubber elongation factor [Rosa chinensis]
MMQYKRVVDLHNLLGGDSNQTSVRGISDENERDRWGKKPMNTDASRGKKELKRLRVLRMAVIYMMMFVLNLYEFAKKNLGPLRSTVWTVEVAMITIVGPVYQRFKGVPDDFFALLDTKIDEAADKFDKHAPPLAKQVVYLTLGSIQKALKKTQAFVNEAQAGGLHTAIHSAATEYNLLVFNQSMKFWVGLEYQCPPTHSGREGYTSCCLLVPEIQQGGKRLEPEGLHYLWIFTFGSDRSDINST